MSYFVENFSWMAFNTFLAFVPIMLVVMMRSFKNGILYIALLLIWLLFLPNTIYLITDLQHMGRQLLRSDMGEQAMLIIQYATLAVLGVMTYIYALEPIAVIFKRMRVKYLRQNYLYVAVNFLVAFGVILGKVQRTHSWYVFTDPTRVVLDVIDTITNPTLMMWVLIMGAIINILFFLFRDYFPPLRHAHYAKKK